MSEWMSLFQSTESKALADRIVRLASEYREATNSNQSIDLKDRLEKDFEEKKANMQTEIDSIFDPVELMNKLKCYNQFVTTSYAAIEQKLNENDGNIRLNSILEKFQNEIVNLEALLIAEGNSMTVPWQLRYACDMNPFPSEESKGKDNKVVFGGRLINADGTAIFEDTCSLCSYRVQEGLLRGLGSSRMHCLDCNGAESVVCMFCYSTVLRAYRGCGDDNSSQRDAIASYYPHVGHRVVEEKNECVVMRNEIFTQTCSLPEAIHTAFRCYQSRPCFGTYYSTQFSTDDNNAGYCYTTYSMEYESRILPICQSMRAFCNNRQQRIAVCIGDSRLFYDLEIATLLCCNVSVTIPLFWNADQWVEVLDRANVSMIFVESTALAELLAKVDFEHHLLCVKWIIEVDTAVSTYSSFDDVLLSPSTASSPVGRRMTFAQFLSQSATLDDWPLVGNIDDETIILHSSGSSGSPKGLIQVASATLRDFNTPSYTKPITEFSYLPPCWGTDKLTVWRSLFNGGSVAFKCSGDSSSVPTLFEQMKLVAPSALVLMPAIVAELKCEYNSKYQSALHVIAASKPQVKYKEVIARITALESVSSIIGNRCRAIGVGGGTVTTAMTEFLKEVTPAAVVNAYGTSESSGISSNNVIVSGVEVFLLDRADLGYCVADQPFPRGEICVKTAGQISSEKWLCSDAERQSMLERYLPNGFFRTGDIGMMPSDREVFVIGRASSMIKLANGIFVCPEKIENCYSSFAGISQLLVTTNRSSEELVAILVLDVSFDLESKPNLLKMLREYGASQGLKLFELPSQVIIDSDKWTIENNSLLGNNKVNRAGITKRHEDALNQAFCIDSASSAIDDAFDVSSEFLTIVTTILAIRQCDFDPEKPLSCYGVDSMTAVQLSHAIYRLSVRLLAAGRYWGSPKQFTVAEISSNCSRELSDKFIASIKDRIPNDVHSRDSRAPANADRAEATEHSKCLQSSNDRACAEGARADAGQAICSFDTLNINEWIDELVEKSLLSSLASDQTACEMQLVPRRGLLLTGATGYFGSHFLAQLLLERISYRVHKDGNCNDNSGASSTSLSDIDTIICIVRAMDNEMAFVRVSEALIATKLINADEVASARSRGTMVCIAGDIGAPWLGLGTREGCVCLAKQIALIVHAAAAVKTFEVASGLALLAGHNIVGTANILMLAAMQSPPINVCFISTMSCDDQHSNIQSADGVTIDIDSSSESFKKMDAYTVSKHIGECLVRRFFMRLSSADTFVILRLPLLTWSRKNAVANNQDWLMRLLLTCSELCMCPAATLLPAWQKPVAYLPVDVCCDRVLRTLMAWKTEAVAPTTLHILVKDMNISVAEVLDCAASDKVWSRVGAHSFLIGARDSDLPLAPLAAKLIDVVRQTVSASQTSQSMKSSVCSQDEWKVPFRKWLVFQDRRAE